MKQSREEYQLMMDDTTDESFKEDVECEPMSKRRLCVIGGGQQQVAMPSSPAKSARDKTVDNIADAIERRVKQWECALHNANKATTKAAYRLNRARMDADDAARGAVRPPPAVRYHFPPIEKDRSLRAKTVRIVQCVASSF